MRTVSAARWARLVADSAAHRIGERFGPGAAGPAATYRLAS
ncbi:hypothetical protein [Streptomyces sp. NPDC088847]